MDLLKWNLAETVREEVPGTDSKVLAWNNFISTFFILIIIQDPSFCHFK